MIAASLDRNQGGRSVKPTGFGKVTLKLFCEVSSIKIGSIHHIERNDCHLRWQLCRWSRDRLVGFPISLVAVWLTHFLKEYDRLFLAILTQNYIILLQAAYVLALP